MSPCQLMFREKRVLLDWLSLELDLSILVGMTRRLVKAWSRAINSSRSKATLNFLPRYSFHCSLCTVSICVWISSEQELVRLSMRSWRALNLRWTPLMSNKRERAWPSPPMKSSSLKWPSSTLALFHKQRPHEFDAVHSDIVSFPTPRLSSLAWETVILRDSYIRLTDVFGIN